MNSAIYKYPLKHSDRQTIIIKKGAKILTALLQGGLVCLWAEVDTEEDKTEKAIIQIVGTGHKELSQHREYINTVQVGIYVWHIYRIYEDD